MLMCVFVMVSSAATYHLLLFSTLPEPELLSGILKLVIDKGDLDFLKYLVSNQSVDVNGECWRQMFHSMTTL